MSIESSAEKTGVPLKPDTTPLYPDLGQGVARYRRLAIRGLASMLVTDRRAYGDAVLSAVRSKQRQELQRELPSHPVHCASGTNHNTGDAIIKAMQTKHRAALTAAASQERRARKPEVWKEMYAKAMKEKAEAALENGRVFLLPEKPIPEAELRKIWTAEKVPKANQDAIIAEVTAKAQSGAAVGPFRIAKSIAKPPPSTAGYEVVTAMQKGKFIVKVPPLPNGTKAMPEVIIANQIKCRFSRRDGGYLATADQIARLQRIISSIT